MTTWMDLPTDAALTPDEQLRRMMAQYQLSDADRQQAKGMGLLGFGLTLAGARRGQEFPALAQAGLLGMGQYRGSLQDATQQKQDALKSALGGAQLQELLRKRTDEDQARQTAINYYGQAGRPAAPLPVAASIGMGPPSPDGSLSQQPAPIPVGAPAGPQGGAAPKISTFDQLVGLANTHYGKGNIAAGDSAMAMAEKYRPKLKETRVQVDPATKQRITVNYYDDGSTQVVPFAPDAEKAHFLDTGKTIGAVDPFTGLPIAGGGMYNKQTTPGEDQSAATAIRGQNVSASTTIRGQDLTNARQIDQNQIQLNNRQIEQVHTIRKELNALPDVQNYRAALPMLKSAQTAPNTRAGDLDLIYAVGKALDPGSVVREGELNLVIKSGNLPQQLVGATSFVMGGGKLPPDQRAELMAMLQNRVGQLKAMHDLSTMPYREQAKQSGLPADQIFINPVAAPGTEASAPTAGLTASEAAELAALRKRFGPR